MGHFGSRQVSKYSDDAFDNDTEDSYLHDDDTVRHRSTATNDDEQEGGSSKFT